MPHIGSLEVEQESIVVAYDPDTGQIVHTHHSVTVKGGKHPDRKTLEQDALHHLGQAQPRLQKRPALLHVNPASLKSETSYKVDVKTGVLLERTRA